MLTPTSVHDAYSDGIAARIATRALFIDAQARAAHVLLAHGPSDREELDALARMCDVPRTVLAFDVADVRS